jgi:hypothetical protein
MNCWPLAEHAGDATPDKMQRLLGRAVWDADKLRDDVRDLAVGRTIQMAYRTSRTTALDPSCAPIGMTGRCAIVWRHRHTARREGGTARSVSTLTDQPGVSSCLVQ